MNQNYSKAKRYAYKLLRGQDHIDLVHDAFVKYYLNKRKNLFDEPLWLVFKVIRDAGVSFFRKKEGRGKYKYQYRSVLDDDLISDDLFTTIARNQQFDLISARLSDQDNMIFKLKIEGYTSKEVSERVNMGRTGVDYRLCKIKNTAKKLWI